MNLRWLQIVALLLMLGCSKVEVQDQELPSLKDLNPENISSRLPIFHIAADSIEFRRLLAKPTADRYATGFVTYWDENRQIVFSDKLTTMEIKGKSSTYSPMKSLGLRFDSPLANDIYQVLRPAKTLKNHNLKSFDALRFRNSGNDFGQTMLKDISYTQLAINANMDVELMYYQQCHLFVNNQYYGLINLRTENNLYGMTGLNQVDSTSISPMKIDVDNGNLEWDEGDHMMADKFVKALKNQNTESLWEMINESSFLDYIIFQDYIGNFDWPHNNTRMYSLKGEPFRFILYDLDFSAYNNQNPILPEMEYRSDDLSKLYREMRKKPGFDERLKQRQKELYKKLTPDEFNQIVDKNTRIIEDEMPYFLAKYKRPESMLQWRRNIDLVRREFMMRDKSIRDKYDL